MRTAVSPDLSAVEAQFLDADAPNEGAVAQFVHPKVMFGFWIPLHGVVHAQAR